MPVIPKPPNPPLPNPKPPLPVPVPLTIRLITDNPLPLLPPGPSSPTRGKTNATPKPGDGIPPPPGAEEGKGPMQKKRTDQFYGAWDRFTLQKERAMRRSNKDRKSRKEQSLDDNASKGSSRSSSPSVDGKGPSLDTDIEGRPGH